MAVIDAHARTVRGLLAGRKYTIDYFQREYRWQQKQIDELVTDLTSAFLSAWRPEHSRDKVATYPPYFLGSVIVSNEGAAASVIDGQQRLTSLSLLLIWVMKALDGEDAKQISDLIFTRAYGTNAYNLDVKERTPAMDALYRGEAYNRDAAPESVRNILDRYEDIADLMPAEVAGPARAMFADWLMERVFLVEITSPTDDDGYAIFETMNDRGLPLSPTDMLKSHLLANAGNDTDKQSLNDLWKRRVDELAAIGKEEDADAIKSWLRGRYAQTTRLREARAEPGDFDKIGTEFHRWVRDHGEELLGLKSPMDFVRFVRSDFEFYTRWYARLRQASLSAEEGREAIFFNGDAKFTLQYPMMLATLEPGDSEEFGWRKVLIVARFIEILIVRRWWNVRSSDYSTMQYAMFLLMKELRGKDPAAIAALLIDAIDKDTQSFANNPRFGLFQTNKKAMRRLLARMQSWVDGQCGVAGTFATYFESSGSKGFDIEHIIADRPDRHLDDFPEKHEFDEHRNRIGGLLLLPRGFNRSYGDMPYAEKRQHYLGQNQFARTLCEGAYDHNPGLRRIIEQHGVPFAPLATFGKAELEQRQAVVGRLAEVVWDPAVLPRIAEGTA